VRPTQSFAPLVISKSLEKSLPYDLKPKRAKNASPQSLLSRRAVIMEPTEKKVFNLIQQINTIKNDKMKKKKEERAARLAKHLKQKQEQEERHDQRQKTERKRVYKMEGILELKKQRAEKRQKYDPKSS
jgi:ribosome biogenesis protein BMS1